jgi:CysZ protein
MIVNAVFAALSKALADFRQPRILALALVPPLAAIAVWIGLAWMFSDDWARAVTDWIANTSWLGWVRDWGLSSIFIWASGIAAVALMLPVVLVTAVLVTDIVAMPVIVPFVGHRHYPRLEQRKGGTVAGSVWNAVVAVIVFAVLWVASLPLWFTGIGALVLPLLISAHFNQRMFRYDALAEHASPDEYRMILRKAGGRLYVLGLLLSLLLYVPVVNLAVPVLSALAFTHLCVAELARLRIKEQGSRNNDIGTSKDRK